MGDVHYIVDKLKGDPFNYAISLLEFSEKRPDELLQLLSDVVGQISAKLRGDIARESPDQTVERLMTFLRIVKYKPSADLPGLRQQLAAADKDVVYPLLKWVLAQPQMLQKRAFVGYYLSLPELPEDLTYDPDVIELRESIRQLQQQFVEAHKVAEALQAETKDAGSLRQRAKSLEAERQRLADHVERVAAQVSALPDKGSYMEACGALKKQQDTEVALSQQLQTQRQQLERAEAAHQRTAARLREVQASSSDASGGRLLELLQEEVAGLRAQVSEKGPKELERRQKRLGALKEALDNGVNTEVDLQRLSLQAAQLQQSIAALQDARAAREKARQGDRAYLQVRQAQQMAGVVQRKREELAAKLERLQEKKDSLEQQVQQQAAAAAEGAGAPISEEAWRAKYEVLRSGLPEYKRMKRTLAELESEAYVVGRTLEVLGEQEVAAQAAMENLEQQQGVQGFASVAADMEKVSEVKSAADEAKGAVLEEISRTVEDINAAIKERKGRLAPQVKALREARQQLQELEEEHAGKKAVYDTNVGVLESRVAALREEVACLEQEVAQGEAQLAKLADAVADAERQLERLDQPGAEGLKEEFLARLEQQERVAQQLREQQKQLQAAEASGVSAAEVMTSLLRMLQIKLEWYRAGGAAAGAGAGGMLGDVGGVKSYSMGAANVMVL